MKNTTEKGYLSIAENLIQTKIIKNGLKPTAKNIERALLDAAPDYTVAYWRRLRRALEVHQFINGYYKSSSLISEVTVDRMLFKSKSNTLKRCKRVTLYDQKLIIEHLKDKGDKLTMCYLFIISKTGCRPSEVENIKISSDGVRITSSKKSEELQRGQDRTLNPCCMK
jgi:integrase